MKQHIITNFHLTNNYYDRIKFILDVLTHRQQVEFALHCAKDLDRYYDIKKYNKVYEARQKILDLVGTWLINPKLVSKKELEDAANAAVYAAAHAANAAYAAANAAYAAANAAANAAYAAASAAAYAANAAYAAKDWETIKQAKLKELYLWLLNLIEFDVKLFKLVI